ncbi:Cell division protein FtsW [Nostocoides japonicum T1-X7]|uniref:Probable peptidoglycan glycosyltransferase FtsW n=2 Tax=Nostocoides japonicum TaxID=99481 RepID=A0A077M4V8_9MICO|nr:Cell division protein FtsW [Tetrasphaera japonica T1-X7]
MAQWARRLDAPTTTYYLLLAVTGALVLFGLVMVLSASMVQSLHDTDAGSAYSIARTQAVFAVLGGVALLIASRFPTGLWKRLAIPALIGALFLQLLVFTPLGVSVLGNRNWIRLGPVTIQPSELIKLGLVLTGGLMLGNKRRLLDRFGHILFPFLVPVVALSLGLVLVGHDLGTVLILAAIVGGMMFAAGVPGKYFASAFALAAAVVTVFVVTSSNRLSRLDVWLGRDTDPTGAYRQPLHGRYALADGGWFGLGLGASREKWSYLSEPHNDFIFAIIGEELGLLGTLVVLALFCALAFACFRIAARTGDNFVRIASAGIMCWIVVQAMINIGSVIGLLPVIGVPLPLVSSGGSSLITTMLALGVLISFARAEPGCRDALAARSSVVRRSLAVVPARRSRAGRRR